MTAWLERLEKYEREGFHEIPGPESNPKIIQWMQGPGRGKWVKNDGVAWCGGGLAGIMDECGLGHVIPPEPLRAASWLKCGVPCEPRVGAIAVFPRAGGNHVTVIKRIRGHQWDCLGCNQSDAIKTSTFDGREARGTRWPLPLKTPSDMTNESRIAQAAARQQRDTTGAGLTGGGQAAPVPAPAPPTPEPSGWHDTVTGWFDQGSQWRGWAETALDFTSFLGGHWRIILGAVTLFFLFRIFYDGRMIQKWRTEDHNEGYSPTAPSEAAS